MFIVVCKHLKLDLTGLSGTGATDIRLLARGIDTSMLKKGRPVVRVEDLLLPSGASVDISIVGSWPAEDLPLELFEDDPSGLSRRGTVTIDSSTQLGTILEPNTGTPAAAVDVDLGPAVDVYASITRGTGSPFIVTVSIGILGWEA